MTRLATIGPRAVHQPLTTAIYNTLQSDTDWDYVAGAALAALTGGNTLNVTSRHHKVTIVGGTIDNIADAAGVTEGQLLELYFTAASTIRNNGGGAGNIRSISGADLAIAAGDVVELVYDGTNWRECARANLNLPAAGSITWGAPADTNLYRVNAAQLQTDGTLTAGGGFLATVVGGNNMFRNFLLAGDAQPAFRMLGNGGMGWGPGGAGAIDTSLSRNAAGILQLGTSAAAGTLYLFGAAAGTVELAAFVTTEAQARWAVTADGTTSWGPGGASARDTSISRAAGGQLNVLNKVLEAQVLTTGITVPATFTPNLASGLLQRANVTAGGAAVLTIAAPANPPSTAQSCFLIIRVGNTGGGVVTLTWNAAYVAGPTLALPASVASGGKMSALFYWDATNWQLLSLA